MKISLLAAMDEKRGIGKDNKLPWKILADLKRFRKLTKGHAVIMGRKTLESIGHLLPSRTNIIITRQSSLTIQGALMAHSLGEAIEMAKKQETEEIFIIGGGEIFEQAMGMVDKLYLTIIEGDFGADTFFPDYKEFKKVVRAKSEQSGGYKYKFLELER